ncbi:oligosaccharide flippase family protein [Pseudomonas defluvii]|nr:oligosaccharide flippase family protein [Pseudomonas defluvii]
MGNYWKSVASVLTGAALAQIIPILGSLVIARLYAPSEFGVFSSWLGIVLLLSVFLTGRFEMALAIEADGEPRRLAVLSTLATACLTALVAAALLAISVAVFPKELGNIPGVLVAILVPTALAVAVSQIWQSWAAAEGSYRKLSSMRIVQAAAVTLFQIIAGVFHSSADALAIGNVLGVLAGLVISAYLMPVGHFPAGKVIVTVRRFWNRQHRFLLFSLPAGSINTAAIQLPVLIVTSRFGAEIGGLLAMTIRILGAPIGLLGKSVLDVFKRHAAASFREHGECRSDYLRTFKILALGSLVFCIVVVPVSEIFFALAFGETWRAAGTIAVWLLPVFALRFIASPLSYMVYIADKQHLDLCWQIALLCMTFATLSVFDYYDDALQVYSVGYSGLYVIYLLMSYRFSLGLKNRI